MFKHSSIAAFAILFTLGACAPAGNIKEMQDRNRALQGQLNQAKAEIQKRKVNESRLREEVSQRDGVITVLGTEKTSRITESSELRGAVRSFIQARINGMKEFLQQGDLLDYIGGELVERGNAENRSLLIVDFANPVPRAGVLTGLAGYFQAPGSFSAKVLRPVGDSLVVVWESSLFEVTEPGIGKIYFPSFVGVEAGDIIGYHFPETVNVGFDMGTGDTRYTTSSTKLGGIVRKGNLSGAANKRAYSLGVYGLLN